MDRYDEPDSEGPANDNQFYSGLHPNRKQRKTGPSSNNVDDIYPAKRNGQYAQWRNDEYHAQYYGTTHGTTSNGYDEDGTIQTAHHHLAMSNKTVEDLMLQLRHTREQNQQKEQTIVELQRQISHLYDYQTQLIDQLEMYTQECNELRDLTKQLQVQSNVCKAQLRDCMARQQHNASFSK